MSQQPPRELETDEEGYAIVDPDEVSPSPPSSPTPPAPAGSQHRGAQPSALATAAGTAPARPSRVKRGKPAADLRATAVPILITVGLLLLVPAVWGVLVLLDYPVPLADRPDALGVARAAAWAGFPLAGVLLLAAAGFAAAVIMGRGKPGRRRGGS